MSNNDVAIISGAASGIGRATAVQMAARGVKVVIGTFPGDPHDILADSGPLSVLAVVVAELALLLQVGVREIHSKASLMPPRHIVHRFPEKQSNQNNKSITYIHTYIHTRNLI